MLVLGIDPGIGRIGYGILRKSEIPALPAGRLNSPPALELRRAGNFETLGYGCLETPAKTPIEERLLILHEALTSLIQEHQPDQVALEKLFFNTNVTTAMAVGRASGVILLAAAQSGVPVYEYTPLQIKSAVAGYGRAEKIQMQKMIKTLLGLSEIPKPDDAADGLAVALCHLVSI